MTQRPQKNLNRKLFFIITALISVLLAISLAGFFLTYLMFRESDRLSNQYLPGFQTILETNRDLYHLLLAERSLCLVGPGSQKQQNYLAEYQNKLMRTEENLQRLKSVSLTAEEKLKIPIIEGGWQTWKNLSQIVIKSINESSIEGQTRAKVLSLNFSTDALYNRILGPLNDLQKGKYIQINSIRSQISRREKQIVFLAGALSISAVGISIIFLLMSLKIVTESKARHKAESALAKEKSMLDLFVNSSSDHIYFKDLSGKFTRVNPSMANWLGVDHPDMAIGKNEMDFLPRSDACVSIEMDKSTLEDGQGIADNEMAVRRGGSQAHQWFLTTRKPLLDDEGQKSGTYGILKDITERKRKHEAQVQAYSRTIQKQKEVVEEIASEKRQLEHHFRQVQKMEALGTLAGGIAHDFNNILCSVVGYVEMAIEDVEKDTMLATNLEAVLISGLRARDLVNQILTFARQAEQNRQPVQVNLIAKETLKLLRATLPPTVRITYDLKCDALVMTDPSQIHQVFMNLCTNAVHAMGDRNGYLNVHMATCHLDATSAQQLGHIKPGEYLKISIADTGSGMAPETVDHIFEPYFTTKKKGKGTGLGLSVVHGIIRGCDGAIKVQSEMGKGTTFHVWLPVTQKQTVSHSTDAEIPLSGTETILIVEDDLLIAALWRQQLLHKGYDVTVSGSSTAALKMFKQKPDRFDLVISDLSMPQLTGDQLAKEMIKLRPQQPVIICTGNRRNIAAEQAEAIGIRAVVAKPLLHGELLTVVRQALSPTG